MPFFKTVRPLGLSLLLIATASLAAQNQATLAGSYIGAPLAPPPSQVPAEQRCSISGQVTNALTGEPVKKATLRLTASSTPGTQRGFIAGTMPSQQGYAISTEPDGTFHLEGIEPGTYTLSGLRSGFLNGNYGAKVPQQMGTTIALSPSQSLTGLTVALTPQAVISGKVVDEDGEPNQNVMIQLLVPTWQRGKKMFLPRQTVTTNDLGEFRAANLSPGKYFLSAQRHDMMASRADTPAPPSGKPDIRSVLTYFPGTTALDSATALEVKAGQDLTGIEIRLQNAQTFHVRGHVVGVGADEGQQHGIILLYPRGNGVGIFMPNGQSPIKADGSFDIASVAPGAYNATLMLMSGNIRACGRQAVDVSGSDVNDVILGLSAPFQVKGVLKVEGSPQAGAPTPNLTTIQPYLFPADFGLMFSSPNVKVEKDGSFVIDNVTAGVYALNAQAPTGTYLKSMLNGLTDIKGSELDLTNGAPADLQIVFRYGPAELDGTVQSPQGAAGASNQVTAAQIVVLPDPLNADVSGQRFSNTDTNGTFSVKPLAPGRYRALALAQLDPMLMQNPDALKLFASKGIEIELKENERKQTTLPLISAEEMNQLLAQAGIDAQ